MTECEINANTLLNSLEYTEDCVDKDDAESSCDDSVDSSEHNLRPIPNYGILHWEFSHPEAPLDLNTLPGYQNIVQHTERKKPKPCTNTLTAIERSKALDAKARRQFEKILYLLDVTTNIPRNKALHANNDVDANIDDDSSDTEVSTSVTDGENTNTQPCSPVVRTSVAGKSLRNHPYLTTENLRSIARERLHAFNLKPGHVIQFVYYGLGIRHPTFKPNYRWNKESYSCLDCFEDFHWKSEYHCHSLVHSGGVRRILCTSCSKSFWYMRELIRHSHIHNNSCPFQCGICASMFKHRSSLLVHLAKIHDMKVSLAERLLKDYICPECYVICDNSKVLTMHMTIDHKVEEHFEVII